MPSRPDPLREGFMVVGVTPETAGKFCAVCYPFPQTEAEARAHHPDDGQGAASLLPGSGFEVRRVHVIGKGKARKFEVVNDG